MTPEAASALHCSAFAPERGWSAAEFTALLANPGVRLHELGQGFALVREAAGETELLTLAVAPSARRRGLGSALLTAWLDTSRAEVAFLEVAADNAAALRLYERSGFRSVARRRGYYRRGNADAMDAVLMRRDLTPGQCIETRGNKPKTG